MPKKTFKWAQNESHKEISSGKMEKMAKQKSEDGALETKRKKSFSTSEVEVVVQEVSHN